MPRKLKNLQLTKRTIITAGIILVAILVILTFTVWKKGPSYDFITVMKGNIAEEVTVTGKTKPTQSVALSFEKGGKIVEVGAAIGDQVDAGQMLARVDASELAAQLLQNQANVEAQQAKLDELKNGSRPENIQIKETNVQKAELDLTSAYSGVLDVLNDSYTKAEDAVRKQTIGLFTGDNETNPQLSFSSNDSQSQVDVQTGRIVSGQELKAWKTELAALSGAISKDTLDQELQKSKKHLLAIRTFLNRVMDILTAQNSLSQADATTYKTNMNTARTNVNTALANVNNEVDSLSSEAIALRQAQDALALEKAGTVPEQIAAQEAQVKQAQAQVNLTQAQLAKSVLRSPINGVVTEQDAKLGQIVAPNVTLVSVISLSQIEIEANVPEVDIGKVALENSVQITFDALQGEIFGGKVSHIDPAETIIDGVVNYKIDVALDKADPRIKSGLTSNLVIATKEKMGVLILPQIAIIENDKGTFVRKMENGKAVDVPITIGIHNQEGKVEVLSGVKEGEQVINIASKSAQTQ